jgi:hypothetical protein
VSITQTVAAIIALCATGSPALAQSQCAPVADALTNLAERYGETVRIRGLTTGGNVLLITAAPGGGWTAIEVKPGGEACMVSAGEAFETIAPVAPGDPA